MTMPATMIAIDPAAPGGPEVLLPVERPVPVPRDDEVLVRVHAAGVNRPDVLQRLGRYPMPPGTPTIPGLEIAGEVVTGSGRWQVAGITARPETLAIPALSLISTTDRIVPAASAARLGDVREMTLGHVGMIVGGRARKAVWEPLAHWLTALPRTR